MGDFARFAFATVSFIEILQNNISNLCIFSGLASPLLYKRPEDGVPHGSFYEHRRRHSIRSVYRPTLSVTKWSSNRASGNHFIVSKEAKGHHIKSTQQQGEKMKSDPFGNLRDWGPVLELVCQLADKGNLSEYQHGLTRILRYRDNWRLREETLKRIGKIEHPDDALVHQVLNIIADENLYYEARILACEAMEELLKNACDEFDTTLKTEILKTVENLLSTSTQHPPIFEPALKKLDSVIRENSVLLDACVA